MRHWRAILLLPLAAALTGCVPFPHTVTLSPALSGVVETAGQPLKDVGVFLASGPQDRPCDTVLQAVKTDETGAFTLPRRSQLRILYAPLVAPLTVTEFTVCLSTARGPVVGYRGFAFHSRDNTFALHCDLERLAQRDMQPLSSNAGGICTPPQRPETSAGSGQ